jgi:hypothetical protein
MREHTTKLVLAGALALGFQVGAAPALAAPCAGFTDVDDANPNHTPFCSSVEWIKNRGVTLGCTTTTYCPDNPVTRLQMAAFMRRLGDALSPAVTSFEDAPGAIDLEAAANTRRVCITPNIDPPPVAPALPGKPYPRRAVIHTTFSGQTNGALNYATDLLFSTDDGASWDFIWTDFVNRDGTGGAHWVSSSHSGALDLNANSNYRFAVLVEREGAPSNDFIDSRCFVTVEVFSRTGSSSPFDTNRVKRPNADR